MYRPYEDGSDEGSRQPAGDADEGGRPDDRLSDKPLGKPERRLKDLSERVGGKETRRLHAREHRRDVAWFGLGAFGLVGWSVAVPTVAGILLGMYIDRRWPSQYSFTLMLLLGGVLLGCVNAWYWVQRESGEIDDGVCPPDCDDEDDGGMKSE